MFSVLQNSTFRTFHTLALHTFDWPLLLQVRFPASGFLANKSLKELAKLLPAPQDSEEPMDSEELDEVGIAFHRISVYGLW